ncbi:MAG TPA: 3-phosphoshikimate 1-carboxyvinyltransferase, partial [Solirubrobacteraceae bacterium]|nr:3-phosphoshikimate 1-carboxyvinyltransferase [Solirubrobacteraceae bacterium]
MNLRFEPARGLSGELRAPADKSISHRAALLGAMAAEPVRIERYLHAADTDATLEAVRALGALVELRDEEIVVRGTGLREARQPDAPIDVHNAGTLLRLLPGWLAAQEGRSFTLDGDESIRRRPVDRIAEPLRQMGAELSARDGRFPPFSVRGARLRAISYELEIASAQVKSCVLLAALAADGATTLGEPARSRDHTERMLLHAGVGIHRNGRHVTVVNADELLLDSVRVPGDASSAAFLVAAGVLVPQSRLLIGDVGVNWTRTGFLRILRRMQGIVLGDLEDETGELLREEPVSDLDVAHGALEGTVVEADEVP